MSNNDKFIRDTEFGKLMEGVDNSFINTCSKCKFLEEDYCLLKKDGPDCLDGDYYFAKDETDETKKV